MPEEEIILDQMHRDADVEDFVEDQQPTFLQEFGTTGLKRVGGFIGEEFLLQLQGIRGVRAYLEMSENDPIASGMIFAITRILSRLPWEIQANPDADCMEDQVAEQLVQECFTDMDTPWNDVLEDILTLATYGWSFMEQNLKIRRGPLAANDWERSKYSDGKIGWRSFRIRAQDTLVQWEFSENGELLGMTQMDVNGGGIRTIPIGKALLFRTSSAKDNPEGRSLLRGAYRPWFYKKRIEDFEGIGIERDLAGLPVATLPAEYFGPAASADHVATRNLMQQLVSDIRNDQNGGVVMPIAWDDRGNKLISLDLMVAAGSKQIDTDKVIQRKSNEMAMSILMDFLMLGHQGVGSFALGTAKIDLWTMAVEAVARAIAETFNKSAIQKLLKWNGMTVDHPPILVFGEVSNVDLPTLGTFIKDMVASGVMVSGPELDKFVREVAKIPAEQVGYGELPA